MVFGKRSRATSSFNDDEDEQQQGTYNLVDEPSDDEDVQEVNEVPIPPPQAKKSKLVEDDNKKPLCDEVIILGARSGKNPGGTKQWRCKHCNKPFTSSYTRIHYHFFGAPPGVKAEIRRCEAMLNNRAAYERVRKKVQDAEKKGDVSSSLKSSTLLKREKPAVQGSIEESFRKMDRDMVDMKVERCLCANGLSFNLLLSPSFHEMVLAINNGPKGYKAPSYEKARTTLLDECKRSLEKELFPIRDTWYTHGVSIVSDGWTNVKKQPLINVLAVNSRGAMFLYADDFSGIEKTGVEIAEYLLKAIEEIGPTNVLQVVTDNASSCKLAGSEIAKVHNHIFWSPCVVHTLNLIFKDMAKEFAWLQDTYKAGKNIVKYFLNHQHALAMFRSQSRLELLKVAKTRFASHYILLRRLADCREALATTVVLRSWRDWVKSGDEQSRKMGAMITDTVNSEEFWIEVENILAITYPIFLVIKFGDGEGPKMGEIYERMDNMVGEIRDVMVGKNIHADEYPKVEGILVARWEKMNIPMHSLGFALNPRFYDPTYLATPASGGTIRKAPNQDKEVVLGVMNAFKKITENQAEQGLLREQFATFHSRKGLYAMPAAQLDAVTMDPIDWWTTYGSETPELAEVATKILAQPITSSSTERLWSTYGFVHSVKRNRLNTGRADKLVYIHSNMRLQSRFSDNYKKGPFKKWDIDPQSNFLEDSAIKLEELRWTSLEGEEINIDTIIGKQTDEPPSSQVPTQFSTPSSTASNPSRTQSQGSRLQQSQIASYVRRGRQSDKGKGKMP